MKKITRPVDGIVSQPGQARPAVGQLLRKEGEISVRRAGAKKNRERLCRAKFAST